jgi:outer membrane protein assembly factor BamB
LARAALAAVAAGLLAGTMATAAPAAAVTQTSSFSTTPLHLVGGPVAAEGAAVVITADASHNLHVEGVAPDTGRVLWSHPYSMSAIIPGLAPTLYVVDNNIVDLVPVNRPSDALVDVEGVNATTGTVVWHGPQHILVSDVPAPCEQRKYFCLLGYNGNASTAMAILNPVTGTAVGTVQGPATAVDLDLYLTDAQTPTLEALSPMGTVAWSKTIDQLFGGPGYNPLNGWDFLAFGGTEIATAGATNADHSNGLDDAKTVGVSLATGATEWSLPGQFQCGGTIAFITPPLDCRFTGTVATPRQKKFPQSYKGLHLSLQGYDAATGQVTWTQPVRNVGALGNGDASFLDATHLLVQLPSGQDALLNAVSGKTAAVPARQALWCSTNGLFRVDEEKTINNAELRAEGTRFAPCTAAGKPATTIPASTPSGVGVTVDGVFLWPSPHGLSRHVVGAAQGIA